MMCLAVPGRIVEIVERSGLKMGKVDYSGTIATACLEYVPEADVGQYVIVHAGFAISIVDEEEARKSLELWSEIEEANKKEGLDKFGMPLENSGVDKGDQTQ